MRRKTIEVRRVWPKLKDDPGIHEPGLRMAQHKCDGCKLYNGSCWHQAMIRDRIHAWFSVLEPIRAQRVEFYEPPQQAEPKKLTKKQLERLKDEAKEREFDALLRRRRYEADYLLRNGLPYVEGTGPLERCQGFESPFPDVDGVGSWGRIVRMVEDSR